jgi:hypothetical protein
VLLGDNADHSLGPRHSVPAHADGHKCAFFPHIFDAIEGGCVLAPDREIAARDIPEGYARVRALESAPQARIDAEHSVNSDIPAHHGVAQSDGPSLKAAVPSACLP